MRVVNTFENNYKTKTQKLKECYEEKTVEDFIKDTTSPFHQRNINEIGYNHLVGIQNKKGIKLIPVAENNLKSIKNNVKNGDILYYYTYCASGTEIRAINNILCTVNYNPNTPESIMEIVHSFLDNKVLTPTYVFLNNGVATFVYNLVNPIIINENNKNPLLFALYNLCSKLSSINNLLIYGGKTRDVTKYHSAEDKKLMKEYAKINDKLLVAFTTNESEEKQEELILKLEELEEKVVDIKKEYNQILVPVKANSDAYDNLRIEITGSKIHRVGGSFADIDALISAIKRSARKHKLSKESDRVFATLSYIYGEQKYLYKTYGVVQDVLGFQSDNFYNKFMLVKPKDYVATKSESYEFLKVYASSLILAKRDDINYKRMLISLFNEINKKVKEKLSYKKLEELLYLNDIEKNNLTKEYSFNKSIDILIANGINVYEKDFCKLRKVAYANEILNRKFGENIPFDEYQKEMNKRPNAKVKSAFESDSSTKVMVHLVETDNLGFKNARGIKEELHIGADRYYAHKKEIDKFFKKYGYLLLQENGKQKLIKLIWKKHFETVERKRRKELKVKVFEKENNLKLHVLKRMVEVSKIIKTNVVETRRKNNEKVFYFFEKGIKVVYNFLADMCQVFSINKKTEKLV